MGKKVAIITGSATGVGAATAVLLAEKDCNVVINYTRSKNEAMETAKLAEAKGADDCNSSRCVKRCCMPSGGHSCHK